jgi:protein-serine/threonine kinase
MDTNAPLYKGRPAKLIKGTKSDYLLYEKVGEGAWAKVRRCLALPSLTQYACKVYYRCTVERKLKGGMARLKAEFEMVSKVIGKHQNVVGYVEMFEDVDKVYVVMEWCGGGSVESLLNSSSSSSTTRCSLETTKTILFDTLSALNWLHQTHHISHHDLKPGNLLIDSTRSRVKLADFTVAERLDSDSMACSPYGTPAYQAPEQLSGDGTFDGTKSDMWSLGVVAYQLVNNGRLPWREETVYGVMKEICDKKTLIDCWCEDGRLSELMRSWLDRDPRKRLSAQQSLASPFFKSRDSTQSPCSIL